MSVLFRSIFATYLQLRNHSLVGSSLPPDPLALKVCLRPDLAVIPWRPPYYLHHGRQMLNCWLQAPLACLLMG